MSSPPPREFEVAARAIGEGKFDKALALLRPLVQAQPRNVEFLTAFGIALASGGEIQEAAERFRQALGFEPRFLPAITWLATLQLQTGHFEEAITLAERAASDPAHPPSVLAVLAQSYYRGGRVGEALGVLDLAIGRYGQALDLLVQKASILKEIGQISGAVETYQRALPLDPPAFVYSDLASIEYSQGRLGTASRHAAEALRKDAQNADGLRIVAQTLTELGKFEEAESAWQKASAVSRRSVLIDRARSEMSVGRFDAARDLLWKAIDEVPEKGVIYYLLASIQKTGDSEDRLLAKTAKALTDATEDGEAAHMNYALGKMHEDLEDYSAAIKFFDEANRLKRKNKVFDQEAYAAYTESLMEFFSRDRLSSAHGASDSRVPLFVVGMMRAGTTLTEQTLTNHADVAGVGEQSFWADHQNDLLDLDRQEWKGDGEGLARRYLEMIQAEFPCHLRIIDKNPANVLLLGMLYCLYPKTAAIHVHRNPADTLLSIWTTPMETSAPFVNDRKDLVFAYREYQRLANHYREVLPNTWLLDVNYEDLTSRPEPILRGLTASLDLAWDAACLTGNNKRWIRTPSVWQARQPINTSSQNRWKHYAAWIPEFMDLLLS